MTLQPGVFLSFAVKTSTVFSTVNAHTQTQTSTAGVRSSYSPLTLIWARVITTAPSTRQHSGVTGKILIRK
ncbi:hypothetical protein F5880DRAFT_1559749 [Lentinula raphanica]|nr:hypothetical protein F5880DRAFT_1559749 [Lentinula raphanica]